MGLASVYIFEEGVDREFDYAAAGCVGVGLGDLGGSLGVLPGRQGILVNFVYRLV